MAIQRNDLCACGSGKKYKKCCIGKPAYDSGPHRRRLLLVALVAVAITAGVWFAFGNRPALLTGTLGGVVLGALALFHDPPSSTSGGDPASINFGV
jgi:hypothetical protein